MAKERPTKVYKFTPEVTVSRRWLIVNPTFAEQSRARSVLHIIKALTDGAVRALYLSIVFVTVPGLMNFLGVNIVNWFMLLAAFMVIAWSYFNEKLFSSEVLIRSISEVQNEWARPKKGFGAKWMHDNISKKSRKKLNLNAARACKGFFSEQHFDANKFSNYASFFSILFFSINSDIEIFSDEHLYFIGATFMKIADVIGLGVLGAFSITYNYPKLEGFWNTILIGLFQLSLLAMVGNILFMTLYQSIKVETWFEGNRIGLKLYIDSLYSEFNTPGTRIRIYDFGESHLFNVNKNGCKRYFMHDINDLNDIDIKNLLELDIPNTRDVNYTLPKYSHFIMGDEFIDYIVFSDDTWLDENICRVNMVRSDVDNIVFELNTMIDLRNCRRCVYDVETAQLFWDLKSGELRFTGIYAIWPWSVAFEMAKNINFECIEGNDGSVPNEQVLPLNHKGKSNIIDLAIRRNYAKNKTKSKGHVDPK